MKNQDERILINIDKDLKTNFKEKCDTLHLTMSARIKYLMKLDSEDKIVLKDGGC